MVKIPEFMDLKIKDPFEVDERELPLIVALISQALGEAIVKAQIDTSAAQGVREPKVDFGINRESTDRNGKTEGTTTVDVKANTKGGTYEGSVSLGDRGDKTVKFGGRWSF